MRRTKASLWCVAIAAMFFVLSDTSVCIARITGRIPRYPSAGIDCQRDISLPECASYVDWAKRGYPVQRIHTGVVVGEQPDTIESRELPSEVTEMIQNSPPGVSSEVLPVEVTDAQKAAAEEYATTTSPTERATILETTGLTNDQLLSIAAENDEVSPNVSNGSNSNSGVVNSSNERVISPLPTNSGGSQQTATTTDANRTGVTNNAGTSSTKGLYIPTKADTGLSDMKVSDLIRNLLNWLLYIVGFVAIIAFVISGMQYLMAGADEEMAKKGKANMTYAIIGVLVALSALIIIRAVQSVLLGAWIF